MSRRVSEKCRREFRLDGLQVRKEVLGRKWEAEPRGGQNKRGLNNNNNKKKKKAKERSSSGSAASSSQAVHSRVSSIPLLGRLRSLGNLIQRKWERRGQASPLAIFTVANAATADKGKGNSNSRSHRGKAGRGPDRRIRPKLDAISGAAAGCLVSNRRIDLEPTNKITMQHMQRKQREVSKTLTD